MSTVFAILFLITIGLLVWGVISPKTLSKFAKKPMTRQDVALVFGIAAVVLLMLTGITAPKKSVEQKPVSSSKAQTLKAPSTAQQKKAPVITTQTQTETQPIAFASTTVQDGNLAQGTTKITTTGVNGVKTLTYNITYTDSKQTDKKLVKEEVTTPPVTQVTSVGAYVAPQPQASASSCNPNYSPCIPNVSYDLDCPDVGKRVRVIGYDQYRLDGDHDGVGCESY